MRGQLIRGAAIGIVVGAVVLAIAGATLNMIGQSIGGITSPGRSTNTQEVWAWVFKGAGVGVISGLLVGILAGAIAGRLSGALMGAIIGAVLLAMGGFTIGTFRPSDRAIDYKNALAFALLGALAGAVMGLIIGSIVDRILRRRANQ